ncbi:CheR family methyltransferase [Pseudomonas profundi]|uniref:CheR family methyltransferase n=1 Tax=Pseudomonas profundi TaxID=1981513 RepID=UPI00123852D7|nr:CheR family methyltransferase [Pseudomonas profundi]
MDTTSAPPAPSQDVSQGSTTKRSHLNFPVVGIGASAGGLQAVLRFFEHMPNDNGMAFVIIMHLSPNHESNAGKIIQNVTKMPVRQVTGPVPIEKNHVYVISPALDLTMHDGHLRVSKPKPKRGGQIAIDLFFRTLADTHHEHAFCLVLSGTGSDGAVGLSRIKEQGGVTLAQLPDDAEYDDMPRSAIATGMVDLVLPVAEMPHKLLELWHNSRQIKMPADLSAEVRAPTNEEEAIAAERALRDILALLYSRTGHNFKHYKRATVLRRVERRLQVNTQPDLQSYLGYLQANPQEADALLADMLIGVTNYFRDREAFEALERDVIPELFTDQKAPAQTRSTEIRVWSAGCSTGEEAYSLAMLLADQARIEQSPVKLQIFATDIDERAISIARAGVYPESILTDIAPSRLREHFVKHDNRYHVKKELRETVLFAPHSLLRDPPFSRLDLITCRNLLIYLDRDVQEHILKTFHFALKPGGYLFLGGSESADMCSSLFSPVDKKNRIFRARTGQVPNRSISAMPVNTAGVTRPSDGRNASGEQLRKRSYAEIHQRVLEEYAPPSVIVNADAEIVHMSDNAGHFLRYIGGEPSHNLLSLIRPELRVELRTAIFQAVQSRRSVEARRVRLKRDGRALYVNMIARPFRDEDSASDYILVLFDEVEDTMSRESTESHEETKDSVLLQLEAELQRTQLELQHTIEQSRVSTEELKASNEELQAINEEFRSATEELETSKEERQSINEELITVNHELKIKVEETDKINDDLQNLITSTDIATVFVDRGMRIKWFTPRAKDLFSMLPVDAGRPLMDITHRMDYPELMSDATQVFESLRPIEREVPAQDGRCYLARLLPYRTTEDHIEGAVLTFIDISARRAAEQEVRLGEERMRLVADSTEDYAIIVQDADGVITSWNKAAELTFGYSRDEAIGSHSSRLFVPEDQAAGVPEDELRRARESGRAEDERWHMRKDGSRFYCSGVVTVLNGESFQGYVKIARDLTERQKQQDEQQEQLAQSQNAIQLKDEFFAVMSHELKHPLNLIQLNAELLGRLPVTRTMPVVGKAVRTISDAVRSQVRIIDDLLDVSRIATGKLNLQRGPVDLGKMLRGIAEVVQADTEANPLVLEIDDKEEPLVLHADPLRVEQIIWNLINNALKFSNANDEVHVRAAREQGQARLDVIDSGHGIAPEFVDKVFDLFGQVETQHARLHKEGLGIGLSLVRQLAEAHEGRVQVRSGGIGKGSHFTVWLPLYTDESVDSIAQEASGSDGRLEGMHVLLVDDAAEVVEVMGMLLNAEGAQVSSFTDASQALQAATKRPHHFDLIMSDIGMPGMDGHELIRALRAIPGYASVPAIALTGYGGSEDAKKALASGFDRHMGKPATYDGLMDTIREIKLKR